MSFEKHSNFNKLANFSEVKFGENKPVLEVELNEMQQIQNEARADIIRDTMPSGFVTLGEIDYDYCANNNNQIKLKTESIAYVNGYRITIPKDIVIEIGEADKEREDLVFLEVWKEAVNDIDTLTEYGGESNAVIDNPIKDSRYPVATSQRVQLKYRIRHIADLDFNQSFNSTTIGGAENYIGWHDGGNFSKVYAMGANPTLKLPNGIKGIEIFRSPISGWGGLTINDAGLWVAGLPNDEASKKRYKTLDGLVYAIPMFRLIRKPHVGLASPFEYKKIHNQLDPKKFAHLVGQENVEKVHSVNIKGTTYKNLNNVVNASYLTTAGHGVGVNRSIIKPNHYRWSRDSGGSTFYPKLVLAHSSFSPNTVYTIQYTIESNVVFGHGFCISYDDAYEGKPTTDVFYTEVINYSTPKATIKRVFTTRTPTSNTSNEICIGFGGINTSNPCWCEISNLIILEGDYSHVEDLTLLPGIQSLGENTNNSITVENNLVGEGTYVPELQNHILPTHPEVTHVTWGEDVVIPPEVEIELKNGEEVIQTITQLPVKLETTGEEKLHVKTMKGQTLVNLVTNPRMLTNANDEVTLGDNKISITKSASGISYVLFDFLSKPSTEYTIILNFTKFSQQASYYGVYLDGVYGDINTEPFNAGSLGIIKRKFTSADTVKGLFSIGIHSDIPTGTKIEFNDIMVLEGDYTNVDIPYFEGMQSVKMPVLMTTGKNLFDKTSLTQNKTINTSTGEVADTDSKWFLSKYMNVQGMTNITISSSRMHGFGHRLRFLDKNFNILYFKNQSDTGNQTYAIPNGSYYFQIAVMPFDANQNEVINLDSLMVEQGTQATSYEPHKSNILRTPSDLELRGIGDVKDELNLLTGEAKERIGEIILDGLIQPEGIYDQKGDTFGFFYPLNTITPKKYEQQNLLIQTVKCDKLRIENHEYQWMDNKFKDEEFISITPDGRLAVRLFTSKASTISEFCEYLSQKPITVQYQLETESIKTVDLTEEDYVGKSKVTYQLAEPLNNIPNGAYDEIKGDKLIKRTNKIYLDGTETWSSFRDETDTTHRISLPIEDGKPSSVCVCSHFEYGTGATVEKVKIYMTVNANLSITVLKSDFPTVDSFKTWLSNNRPMVIYELANPIEIPLKEVSPLECDFSLNRQFKRGYENYLKELPNGVKDVIENGKVTRNIARAIIDGTENWDNYALNTDYNTDTENTLVFMVRSSKLNTRKSGKNNYLCKTLSILEEGINIPDVEKSGVWIHSDSQYYNFVYIRVFKNWLPTPDVDGLKKWLNKNPLEILFEVQTPTTEELTEENSRYVPYMPLNSYVGSLYVADGINQTKFLTDFSPSEYEVQTSHRYFSNEFNVFDDTTLKKSPYGHKTYLEEVDGKYVEKFIAGLEKHEIEDLRHKVSLTGFDYSQLLQDSFLKLIKGELS